MQNFLKKFAGVNNFGFPTDGTGGQRLFKRGVRGGVAAQFEPMFVFGPLAIDPANTPGIPGNIRVNVHIKITVASGPTNGRSTRPIPFPSASMFPTQADCALQRIGHIRPPVRALFFANFRFAGILHLPYTIYPFFGLRVFTGLEMAFLAGRPLFLVSCTDFAGFRAILGRSCTISGVLCAISAGFCSIGWLHQKNVPVPVL